MSRPQSWRMVITLVVVWVGLWIALDGVVVDDAGLVFAYARHLAAGLGPVAQPGAAPIEAYSSPSWLGILAGITRMGLSPAAWARPLGLVLGGLTLAATRDLVRAQGLSHLQANTTALVLAGSVSFAYACSNGLETALLCAGLVSLLWSGQRAPWALGPLAAGVALTRPEGLLLAAVGLLAGKTLNHRLSWQSIGIAWGFAAGAFASYLAWRWALFGDWLPTLLGSSSSCPLGYG